MSNKSVENVYTRSKANVLSKQHFWKLVGMMAIIFGVSFAITFLGEMALTARLPVDSTTGYVDSGAAAGYTLGTLLMSLMSGLVSGGLGLGMTAAMLKICKGEENVTVGAVFSRMGQCLKMFGLSLWVGLKTIFWALPGYAVMIAGVVVGTMTTNVQSVEEAAPTMVLLIAGMVLMVALIIPAVYRYILSTYVLADEEDRSVFECVNLSKQMMKGHKWQAFKLIVPYILIMYAVIFGAMIVVAIVASMMPDSPVVLLIMTVLPLLLMVGCMLYFSIRAGMSYCLFYLKRRKELESGEETAEEAPAE